MIEQLQTLLSNVLVIKAITTLIGLVALLVVRRLILRVVYQRTEDAEAIYTWRKTTEFIGMLLGVIVIAAIWLEGNGMQSASTYFGLLSAGIAISLQDPLTNFIGWIFILARRPFEVGDRVEIGDIAGDVIDIRYFQISLLEIGKWVDAEQSTGRIMYLPNRFVFNHPVANYTSGIRFIWNEIPVEVTFESDWRAAKTLLEEIAVTYSLQPSEEEVAEIRRTAKRSNIRAPRTTPVVYTKVAASGVVLTLRYLCRPRRRRNSEQQIWEAILELFASRDDMDFAYPTQRIFYHPHEGKTLMDDHSEVAHPRSHLMED
jgi:small-conductance mechanosensitive channel